MRNVFKLGIATIGFTFITLFNVTAFGGSYRDDEIGSAAASNGGRWGNWTGAVYCPPGSWADGFSARIEESQGSNGDDSGMNAVSLHCSKRNGDFVGNISPHDGFWGYWKNGRCNRGFLRSFSLKVEPDQGSGDDTAANGIQFACSDGGTLEAGVNGGGWGEYGEWERSQGAICGLSIKIEPQQGSGDDSALNNVRFYWCNY